MKFARDFRESLASQDFPAHWLEHAIPYGPLKKCLKKIIQELHDLGLDPETLQSLSDPENKTPLALRYRLNTDCQIIRPTLTVDVRLKGKEIVDASLNPASRIFFEKIAAELAPARGRSLSGHAAASGDQDVATDSRFEDGRAGPEPGVVDHGDCETVEVPLVFDSQFFRMLHTDVSGIDGLQEQEQQRMNQEITNLGQELALVTKPSRFHRTDLEPWRHILELYVEAEVFFATREQAHGTRSSQNALKQLKWFQDQVEKEEYAKKFKLRPSQAAFGRFLRLNASLVKYLQFRELNQLAVRKILKKFDKRTSFHISQSFDGAVQSHLLMAGNVSKDVCAKMSTELVSIVPQINDYLCPICFTVAYRPIRLACQHVFCIRCMVKIQRRREKHCPLCRAEVVMEASALNLDTKLARHMKKCFPQEVREKQRQNQLERDFEEFGRDITTSGPNFNETSECVVM